MLLPAVCGACPGAENTAVLFWSRSGPDCINSVRALKLVGAALFKRTWCIRALHTSRFASCVVRKSYSSSLPCMFSMLARHRATPPRSTPPKCYSYLSPYHTPPRSSFFVARPLSMPVCAVCSDDHYPSGSFECLECTPANAASTIITIM